MDTTITTTDGKPFTHQDSRRMAGFVLRALGGNMAVATEGWRRMLQNGTTASEFEALVPSYLDVSRDDVLPHLATIVLRRFGNEQAAADRAWKRLFSALSDNLSTYLGGRQPA